MLFVSLLFLFFLLFTLLILIIDSQVFYIESNNKILLLANREQSSWDAYTHWISTRIKKIFPDKSNKILDQEVEHILRCLEVLLIKSETPLVTALQLVCDGLPDKMSCSQIEFKQILTRAKQDGLRETLISWSSGSARLKACLGILLASLEGASKASLQLSFHKLMTQIEEENKTESQGQAENLQLYLLAPALIMLLIISYPMMDAVAFLMGSLSLN